MIEHDPKLAEARAKLRRWKKDPLAFVREVFGTEPDGWQADVLRAFPTAKRLGMKACKNPGKTAVLSWCMWNFLATRPYPKVVATSINGPNLADGLWTEMAKWQEKSQFLKDQFEWSKTAIVAKDHRETWFAVARTWRQDADQTQQANTLAGKHADYMLFVLDEAGGIPDSVMVAADAALGSGIETKLLMAGNPTHLEGPLYRACTSQRDLWTLFEITGDPDDPNRAPRVDIEWAREAIKSWGRDDPWVKSNVLGQFPPASINSLLGPDDVSAAMKRGALSPDLYTLAQKRTGVDVSRFGDDRTVLFPRQGLMAFEPVVLRNLRSHDIAARIAMGKVRWGSEVEFVDDTGGYGAGVLDALVIARTPGVPVNFSGKADDPRYFNKRSEMWFRMADWVKRGGSLPQDPELARELTAPTYTFMNGKFKLEEKDQIKLRLGFSPDKADALALTFAHAEMPTRTPYSYMQGVGVPDFDPHRKRASASDFDPLSRI